MKSVTMKIELLTEKLAYSPGDTVNGSLNLNVNQCVIINRISVTLTGIGVVRRANTNPEDESSLSERREVYIQDDINLHSSKEKNVQDLYTEVGNLTLPFSFLLPQNIPSSFESPEGYIRYTISSSLEGLKLPLISEICHISVNAKLDLNSLPKSQYPSTVITDNRNNGWWCCSSINLHAGFHTARRGYVPGEVIILNAEINNLDSKPVVSVKAQLTQVIKYHHKPWPPRKIKRIASEVTRGYILPHEAQYWIEEPIVIPPVVSSYLQNCSLIDVKYKMYFRIAKAGMPEIVLKFPIIIGNVPLMGCVDVLSEACNDDQHSIATLERANERLEHCFFGPYDVMERSESNAQEECLFSPRYITYYA